MLEISDQKYLETYVFINIWQEMKKEICSFMLKKGFIPKNASWYQLTWVASDKHSTMSISQNPDRECTHLKQWSGSGWVTQPVILCNFKNLKKNEKNRGF